jgi:3-hydroxyisobutyrate dehydrogenase
MENIRVAFVGLGVMGFPMAGHLAAAGHTVSVYNRTTKTAARWCERFDGKRAATPKLAVHGADFVFTCVGNDNDLRDVVLGNDGVFAGMKPGAILVDHTTTSADVARELAQQGAQHQFGYVDAPVSGGQSGAENGALTVMCGADAERYRQVEPVIACYAKACVHMGEVGSGQLTKMVNQICIAGLLQGLSEGMNFGMKAELDMDKVIDVISNGAAQSWQMDNRARTMCRGEFNFGFAVDWMRKDLGIAMAEAKKNAARLPVTAQVDQSYAEVQTCGGARWDTSSLISLLADFSSTQKAPVT